jgi:metallo-beta-lactamase family protein
MGIKLSVLEDRTAGIGACSLLQHNNSNILLDCGYYYSHDSRLRMTAFPIAADSVDVVILTHGHLGHCGLLPVLIRDGFEGKIYCTEDCRKIAMFSMLENALLQQEEKQYWESKNPQRLVEPLYNEKEVAQCSSFFEVCEYHKDIKISDDLTISFHNAGHSPGSALVKICLKDNDHKKNILLAGDVGLEQNDLNTDAVTGCSYDAMLLPACSVTNKDEEIIESSLAQIINQAVDAGGNIIIPAFSIDRRDEILMLLNNLLEAGEIPKLFAFIDSPIAGRQVEALQWRNDNSKAYPIIQVFDSVESSKTLNQIRGSAIIIAGHGRDVHGRIGFHLLRNIDRPESAIVLFGDKREHPFWKAFAKGDKKVSILDKEVQVKAKIYQIKNPCIHWDVSSVVGWIGRLESPPGHVLITHGGSKAKKEFCSELEKQGVKNVLIPNPNEQVTF